eukprot:9672213-Lingulodinium_polyedra.AAC.1
MGRASASVFRRASLGAHQGAGGGRSLPRSHGGRRPGPSSSQRVHRRQRQGARGPVAHLWR